MEINHPDTHIIHVKCNERKKRSVNLSSPRPARYIAVTLLNLGSLDIIPQLISQHWDHCFTAIIKLVSYDSHPMRRNTYRTGD